VDGEYSIRGIDPQGTLQGVGLPGTYTDATLSVDVRFIGDVVGRSISLECRRQPGWTQGVPSSLHSYKLWVYPATGEYAMTRYDAGKPVALQQSQPNGAIFKGNEQNHLKFGCIGSTISARVNDQLLASVDDATYQGGASTINVGGPLSAMPHVEFRLDNLVVYGP
jgi:hypothetical protein